MTTEAQIEEAYPKTKGWAWKIVEIANKLNIDPAWLANIIQSESQFNTKALNLYGDKPSYAAGLIQFIPSSAKSSLKRLYGKTYSSSLGTGSTYISKTGKILSQATDKVLSMNNLDQMDLVYQYMKTKGKLRSQDDVILAIFYPHAIGKGLDFDIADHYAYDGGKNPRGSEKYKSRYKYLVDINGGITYAGDYAKKLSKHWKLIPPPPKSKLDARFLLGAIALSVSLFI